MLIHQLLSNWSKADIIVSLFIFEYLGLNRQCDPLSERQMSAAAFSSSEASTISNIRSTFSRSSGADDS